MNEIRNVMYWLVSCNEEVQMPDQKMRLMQNNVWLGNNLDIIKKHLALCTRCKPIHTGILRHRERQSVLPGRQERDEQWRHIEMHAHSFTLGVRQECRAKDPWIWRKSAWSFKTQILKFSFYLSYMAYNPI